MFPKPARDAVGSTALPSNPANVPAEHLQARGGRSGAAREAVLLTRGRPPPVPSPPPFMGVQGGARTQAKLENSGNPTVCSLLLRWFTLSPKALRF